MLTVIFLIVLVAGIYGIWRLSGRPPGRRISWSAIWRLAFLIAILRISTFWVGYAGLQRADWYQRPAYIIMMFGLPEIYIAKAARTYPLGWAILCTLTLAATSFVWSAAIHWVANRLRSKSPI